MLKVKQVAAIYLILIFAAVLTTQSDAKRGCALYGHSCYGGHGKRSEVVEVFPRDEGPTYKQLLDDARREAMMMPDETRDFEVHPRFKLIKMIRQWLDENRPSPKVNDPINMSNELFKDSTGNSI